MSRTRIKICGLTSEDAAVHACRAGADAIGLMFYEPSPRHLDLPQARRIRQSLPPFVDAVAVVVNPAVDYLERIVASVGVSLIQFHGEETNDFCQSFGLPFVKVLRVADDSDLVTAEAQYPDACGILLDTHVGDVYGGSGKTFDWNKATYGGAKPVILAGGLDSDNVCDAIKMAAPWAVDVSSGVETDGKKDPLKMTAFCESIRNIA